MTAPGALDLLTIDIDERGGAETVSAPAWAGPEVTDSSAYDLTAMALNGLPGHPEIPVSNAALHALLDVLEGQPSPRLKPFTPSPLAEPDLLGRARDQTAAALNSPMAAVPPQVPPEEVKESGAGPVDSSVESTPDKTEVPSTPAGSDRRKPDVIANLTRLLKKSRVPR
jgi:hypothetical protein